MLGPAGPQVPRPGARLSPATMCFQSLTTGRRGLATLLCARQQGCLDTAEVGECGLLDRSSGAAPLLWVPGLTRAPCSPSLEEPIHPPCSALGPHPARPQPYRPVTSVLAPHTGPLGSGPRPGPGPCP